MEVAAAVRRLKEKKAPGADNVTAEEIQADDEAGIDAVFELCEKVMAAVIMQIIRNKTEGIVLSEAQAGFKVKRSTIDQIFTLRRLAERYYEFSKHLYIICYVDYQKALH